MCVSEITAAGFCGLCGGVNSFAGRPGMPYFGNLAPKTNSPPITDGEQSLFVEGEDEGGKMWAKMLFAPPNVLLCS